MEASGIWLCFVFIRTLCADDVVCNGPCPGSPLKLRRRSNERIGTVTDPIKTRPPIINASSSCLPRRSTSPLAFGLAELDLYISEIYPVSVYSNALIM